MTHPIEGWQITSERIPDGAICTIRPTETFPWGGFASDEGIALFSDQEPLVTADPNPQPDEMIDPVLAERQRAAYRARDILFGMDPGPSDILVVADWLMTGEAKLAMAFDRALAENHRDFGSADVGDRTPSGLSVVREQGAAERPPSPPYGLSPADPTD